MVTNNLVFDIIENINHSGTLISYTVMSITGNFEILLGEYDDVPSCKNRIKEFKFFLKHI